MMAKKQLKSDVSKTKRTEFKICAICGDQASGLNFNVVSCIACRGFFRGIAISRNYNCDSFVCRYQGNCTINKTNRKRCRFCRYLKCLLTGMNLNTTRRRRQLTGISTQRQPNVGVWPVWGASNPGLGVGVGHLATCTSSCTESPKPKTNQKCKSRKPEPENTPPGLVVLGAGAVSPAPVAVSTHVNRAAAILEQVKPNALSSSLSSDGDADGGGTADDIVAMNKEARISDVCESMKQQLLAFIEWAKEVPYFDSLNLSDRIALVREHACEHLLLQASYRSLGVNDFVLLGNGTVASSSSADPTIAFTVTRVLKELIAPLRRIQMDDSELVLLKALLLFDPHTTGLTDVVKIRSIRFKIQVRLQDYINNVVHRKSKPCYPKPSHACS